MKRTLILGAMLALIATTATAGDGSGKCEHGTQECLDYMAQKMESSGWVGVELEGIEVGPGNLVVGVIEGSPAAEAGLQKGDILMAINNIDLVDENMEQIMEARKSFTPGSEVVWTMLRGEKEKKVNLTLARMPADILARYVGQHMLQHAQLELASGE